MKNVVKPKLASVEEIEEVFQQKVACFTVEGDQVTVGLFVVITTTHCTLSCILLLDYHVSPVKLNHAHKGQHFNKYCTSPDVVNTYLRQVINYPSDLSGESLLCLSCYMHFINNRQT